MEDCDGQIEDMVATQDDEVIYPIDDDNQEDEYARSSSPQVKLTA